MNKYLVLEIGKSAYTEFKMKDGEFMHTEDAILVDEIEANSKDEAYEKLMSLEEHKDKSFDHLIVRQVI
jgi:hypothetical protein